MDYIKLIDMNSPELNMFIRNSINEYCTQRSCSISDMSDATGISYIYLQGIVNGIANIQDYPLNVMMKIMDVCGHHYSLRIEW